ncbi:hypothetical protein LAZ67_18001721 [Cordylochernes scorpioides]|uniref:ATP-dependent DNA helicase n=1 Tax=Cordylochernes scorpioides TaxID=51811 RepID=A0ABY6LGW4_9ARAC|nr:hypothetical protein LAZ67_18001721 [Cordylochernes scorpioides]
MADSKEEEIFKEWEDKNDEAFGIIIVNLSPEQAGIFIGETNAKTVWDELKRIHTRNIEDKIIDIGLELKSIQMRNNEGIEAYITRARNIASRSANFEHPISPREMVYHVVRGLLPKFENIAAVLRPQRSASLEEVSRHFKTISLYFNGKRIVIANIYIHPNSMAAFHIQFISEILEAFGQLPIILCGDFNSRHPLWFDSTTNKNGYILKSIIEEQNLFVHNLKIPTCRNASIIDLTISNKHSIGLIHNWRTSALSVTSDHLAILFDIFNMINLANNNRQTSTWKFREKSANWTKFAESISPSDLLDLNSASKHIVNCEDIDNVVNKLTNLVIEAAYSSLDVKHHTSINTTTSKNWWNKELQQLKEHLHYLRNLYYRGGNLNPSIYRAARNKYLRAINRAKKTSWKIFIEENESTNAFGNAYRIFKRLRSADIQVGIPLLNKTAECMREQKMKEMLTAFFPDDDVRLDNEEHTLIRNHIPSFTNREIIFITEKEIKDLCSNLNIRKAPGPDNFSFFFFSGFCIMPRRGRGRLAYRTRRGNNAPNPISPVPTEYIIGGLDIVCPYCSALHFPGETVGSSCCHKGKVILPTLSSFPYEMMELMTSNSVEAKYFQTNIRSYNSSLAFASMGAQVDVFSEQGPFCYRIHGQIYHLTGPLHPHGNRAPSYAQLYILDSEAANNTRIAASRPLECHPGILTLLDSVLRRVNPYTSAYRQMHQVELAEEHRARIENRQMCQVQMLIRQNHCRDLRRYNAPSVSEVAAIFVDQDGHVPSNRDIAVFPHDCGLVRISPLNPNCDPMTYPLLFPAGDPGWAIGILHEENMRTSTRNHVTMLQFYSYRLAIRPGFSPIHYGRRLFQQYVVDAYVKTKGNRLNYIRQNQSLLRVELYQGLMDYIHEQEHSRGVRIGRIFILPSSFPGSSRAMQQNYQDAMAIVRKFGRPDLFVTFTCNPRWTDIVENLLPNQNPSDRPDLVARVFNLKLQQLLHEIVSQHVLGVVIARVHVVEFQKRGLPHAHMLFMLREEDKPRDRDAIDRLVCAEIPSPTMQVQLYDMVRKHMIHGPCGNFNLHSPCMSDGKCTKDFPKSFLQLTEANNNGYPRYRRRDDGQTLVVGTHEVDNRWVVPYNPYLLVRFNAHINVEVCASVKSVKYLFKYVYKGHDRAEVEVSVGELDMESRAHNEIKNFLDARYVSAPEAMWRMFEYRLHAHSHTICRLAVHLPNFQSVYFVEGSEEQALENASRRRTTLTAWFQLNCVNVSARSLLYGDIPSAYVFRQNQWSARVRGGALCIGRMCSVNPKDSERYHLRLLLLHVAGAQSFEDLRTVDDIVCSTFKEAAQRRGLLADDSEWDACLAEAALFQMPCQLRQLFATILIYNNPTNPVSLWTKYKGYLSEDFSRATSDAAAEQMTLRELEFQLRENRLSCHHYGLPAPLTPLLDSGEDHLDVNAELQIGTEMYRSLTPDQKSIVDTIVDSLNVNPRCFFIDGPGGTGKTYVYNTLIHCVRAVGKIVIPLASTGIAATLLSGGQTVHSRFKLPIPLLENSVAAISANSSEAELIRRSSLIIWDEAPMAHYRALEIVDRLLKDIMHCDLAFGGKVVVLGGDFRQVLPVVPRASRAEIVAACIKQSKLWPLFVILRLTQNMRAGIDAQSFSQWLLKVGDGDLPTDQQGLISLPESCIFHGVDLVQEIFGSSYGDITALSQSVILTPKNTDSLEINEKVLDRLPNRSQCFLSVDSVECENVEEQNNYPTEFLNSLTPTGMPPHRLNLKIGAIVMLLRNLNPKQGLCNGTRMVIQRMRSHVLEAQILTGTKVGQTVLVPKISLAPSDTNLPFILKRRQFPLRQKYYGLRPYHVENTGSRPITEVKQRRARSVLGRVTTWEHRVL